MQRRIARELALQALYRFDLTGEDPSLILKEILKRKKYSPVIQDYARKVVGTVYFHIDEIDKTLKKKIKNWEFHRVASIDRTILRMGSCELLYFADIPFRVTINESIEIAKKYGDIDSGKFINGILDAIAREFERKNSKE